MFLAPSHHVFNVVDKVVYDVKDFQSELLPPHQKELDALLMRTKEKYAGNKQYEGKAVLPIIVLVRLAVDFDALSKRTTTTTTSTTSTPPTPQKKKTGGKCHQQNLLEQKERKLQNNIDPATGKRRRGRPPGKTSASKKKSKDSKDAKDAKEAKGAKDAKDAKDAKEAKEAKGAKDAKDSNDAKGAKEAKDAVVGTKEGKKRLREPFPMSDSDSDGGEAGGGGQQEGLVVPTSGMHLLPSVPLPPSAAGAARPSLAQSLPVKKAVPPKCCIQPVQFAFGFFNQLPG